MKKDMDFWDMPAVLWNRYKEHKAQKAAEKMQKEQMRQRGEMPVDDAFDYVGFLTGLREEVVDTIRQTVRNNNVLPERKLLIYIADDNLYTMAKGHDLATALADYVSERLANLHSVELRKGIIPESRLPKTVMTGIQMLLCRPETVIETLPSRPDTRKVATVTMRYKDSKCILFGETVTLEAEEGKIWYIGWGQKAVINNHPRENHIALGYKEPEKENSEYFMISRAHAYIKYMQGYFFLHVERGTRELEERTKIERGEEIIELSDKTTGRALRNGDVIRLNNEYLLFTIEDRKIEMENRNIETV